MTRFSIFLALSLIATPALAEPWPVCSGGHRAERRVTCVVDGDTVWINGEKLRLVSINAPEINGACAAETRMAAKARDRLADLLGAGSVLGLERHGVGVYGRPLVRILIDGGDVGSVLIAEGLAVRYRPHATSAWCGVRK